MNHIFTKLMEGSREVGPSYKACMESWMEALDSCDGSVEDLRGRIRSLQTQCEQICGDIYLGKVLTPYAGFCACREKGFDPLVLLEAFQRSMVASEVKAHVKEAYLVIFVLDGPEFQWIEDLQEAMKSRAYREFNR